MDERDERRRRLVRVWPLYGLRVVTPRVELRFPDDDDLAELAEEAAGGVHDPATMPFGVPWTDVAPPLQQRNTLQHHWGRRATWRADAWHCPMAVVVDGAVVGVQELFAESFAVTRLVASGSWLARRAHGQGLGTEMRSAVLHLIFHGLAAEFARSSAFEDNGPSQRVSTKLGYRPNGVRRLERRGEPVWIVDLLLDRATWEARRRDDIAIEGLEPCLELFGVAPVSDPTSR